MRKLQKFDGTRDYMFPTGQLATPAIIRSQYSAIDRFTHIVETDENCEVLFALQNLSAMRMHYNIASSLTEDEAIAAIEAQLNTVPESVPTADERSAAALEMIAVNGMPDIIL